MVEKEKENNGKVILKYSNRKDADKINQENPEKSLP